MASVVGDAFVAHRYRVSIDRAYPPERYGVDLAQTQTPLIGPQRAMPYATNDDLPSSVRAHLPEHAQDIYRQAFNHAYAAHAGDIRQEEAAHRIAWAAVKRSYVKVGGRWVPRHSADAQ